MGKKAIKIIHRKLGKEQAEGLAYKEEMEIHIEERLRKKSYLLAVIHELLHVYEPEFSEEEVNSLSINLCNTLWKLKFRRVDE